MHFLLLFKGFKLYLFADLALEKNKDTPVNRYNVLPWSKWTGWLPGTDCGSMGWIRNVYGTLAWLAKGGRTYTIILMYDADRQRQMSIRRTSVWVRGKRAQAYPLSVTPSTQFSPFFFFFFFFSLTLIYYTMAQRTMYSGQVKLYPPPRVFHAAEITVTIRQFCNWVYWTWVQEQPGRSNNQVTSYLKSLI